MKPTRILAVDVGAGTQDILLWEADQPMENCVKLVLPSWTKILARRVRKATQDGQPVYLTGNLMGGGPIVSAMKRHLHAGHPVYTTPRAALTIRDNLDQVRDRGYTVLEGGESPPDLADAVTLRTHDIDLEALEDALAAFDVTLPETVAVAVQDHGECMVGSNRQFRFQLWRQFVDGGGQIIDLAFREPPACYTRMLAVQQDAPGAVVMDTGPAALWGILEDERAAAHREEGFILVNIGNQHTLGVLLRGERILGLFEHHTVLMDRKKLQGLVESLQAGELSNEQVFADNGHGATIHSDYVPGSGFDFVAVTGPQRQMAEGMGYAFAAPYGDMMLTGCFGLVAATRRLLES
ncbi:MAG: DUF1786 domain-containing protein [Anaerolineae bacterium]|jgi:uncharacterized protein (DUF1786 family)